MPPQWQIRFDGGHQQRYLPDRQSVLRYVLSIGARSPGKRFEVFTESAPVPLADGSPGGRAFSLVETIDLARPGEAERLHAELADLAPRTPPREAEHLHTDLAPRTPPREAEHLHTDVAPLTPKQTPAPAPGRPPSRPARGGPTEDGHQWAEDAP